ncbi:DUF2199 domain-containing protein [Sphingosinithalassobacter portus]|uniref:DUF2199 domain-containing protein n=1 Tax=Stakelama portus TaxID=2676234 RepID=UPI000D6DD574|nr:DUF2199 domain-containing protein [Sphingosinithalassobacter portus]
MFGWGKKPPPSAAEVLRSGRWRCENCATEHSWPFDLAARAPDPWSHGDAYQPNSELHLDGDFLSEDFCVIEGRHFMVRAVLTIPVNGVDGDFGFGCWTTLSRENFGKYVDGFDSGDFGEDAMWSGWLVNRLAIVAEDDDPIALWVQPRPERQRPLLWAQSDEHVLGIAQDEGISPETMLEILRRYGHAPE